MSAFYEMSEMTSSEFRDVAKTIEIALVPVGATEQHGPHLALATDYVVAHRLAQAIARRLYSKAVVAPPLPFGFSHHHTGFAGTITIEPETFAAVCIDIARTLKRDGVRRLLFVNGHQGNNAILNVVTNKIYYELGIAAATSFYFAQAADRVKAHSKTSRVGHACEIETSVLMYLAPEFVRRKALERGEMIPTELKHAFNNQPHFLQMPLPFHLQTQNGAFGDARLATVEIGRDIVETAIDRTLEFIDGFIKV